MGSRPICDYEGSAYRTEFWGQGRDYEDRVERVALRALLPPSGRRLIEIGAGYGRLADLYSGYEEVVLLDYAHSQLLQARERLGDAGPGGLPRYRYVQANFYCLPFATSVFDTVVMVRTLHHAADAPAVLHGIARTLPEDGTLVLEYANKRNLKAILRYLMGRQAWSPFDHQPVEFVELNFDFHPAWVRRQMSALEMRIERVRAVSSFRLGLLKRTVPTGLLVAMDRLLQPLGALGPLSPSVFLRAVSTDGANTLAEGLFRCTQCGSTALREGEAELVCAECGTSFPLRDGIYDFVGEEV